MEPPSTINLLSRKIGAGPQHGARKQALYTLPLPQPQHSTIRAISTNRAWPMSSSNIPHKNIKDCIPNVSRSPCASAKFFEIRRHGEGLASRSYCHSSQGTIINGGVSSQTSSINDDEEIVVIHDKGKVRLFPNEPEMSFEFKEYLLHLNKLESESIMKLKQKPPILLDKLEKCSARPKDTSYCFITTEDLDQVHKEIDRIVIGWSEGEKRELVTNTNSSIQLLCLQNYLTHHILAAKERCIQDALRKLQAEGQNDDTLSPLSSDERKNKISEMDEVGRTLFWQVGVFGDMYRQTLLTPFMLEKKQKKLPRRRNRKRGPTTSTVSSDTSQKKSKNSRKKTAAPSVNVNQVDSNNM